MSHAETAPLGGPPELIGPYQVVRLVEQNSFHRQYLVRRPGQEAEYCLRTMMFSDLADEDTVERYRRECELLTRLRHPNLPEVLDWGFWQGGAACFLTPVLVGRLLGDIIKHEAPLPWAAVQPLLQQLLSGLSALHEAGIVHRGLTPASLHVAADGTLHIIDFSLIRLPSMLPLTATGTTFGDTNYAAPEQLIDAKRADAQADLYSVGAVAYQLLSGHLPREKWSAAERQRRLPLDAGRPLADVARGLPPAVYDFVGRLLRPARRDRPASAIEALALLPTADAA